MTELILALGAGLLSFLSPCVLPLIPGYISYVSGKSLNELLEEKRVNILPIVLFTVGFSLIFIAFGATSSLIGKILLNNSIELRIFSGLVIIFFSPFKVCVIKTSNFLNNSNIFFPLLRAHCGTFGARWAGKQFKTRKSIKHKRKIKNFARCYGIAFR